MEAINYINSLSKQLILLIVVGGAFMGGLESIKYIMADDESEVAKAKKNIRKVILGTILGTSISGFISFIFSIL